MTLLTTEKRQATIHFELRLPTVEESELFDRDPNDRNGGLPFIWACDTVIDTPDHPEAQAHIAAALQLLDWCAVAHVIPGGGVYLQVG